MYIYSLAPSQASAEDSEEVRERKRLERRLREKELAYRERLKNWEAREDKRRKEYEIEKKKEIQKRRLAQKEAKKLKQFMEDYEDEKDDPQHYKGSNLEKRLKLREKEIEADFKDRQKEKEELEELKKKLIEKGHLDAEIEAKRV
jgi:RNA-binding protein 25